MNDYSCIEEPCFVCNIEDELNELRGTQSHPINCGWRLKEEHKVMKEELMKDGKILFWSESENRPKIVKMIDKTPTT